MFSKFQCRSKQSEAKTILKAAGLSNDPVVRYGALMRDLGKGGTPTFLLPRHHGHEQRGEKLAKEFWKRWSVPNAYGEFGVLAARYHTDMYRLREMRPATVVRHLEAMDAFRKPQRLYDLVEVGRADTLGRGAASRDLEEAPTWRACLQACLEIDNGEFLRQGLEGRAFAEAVRQQRIRRVTLVLKETA